MSDTLQPHGLRPLCPWNSINKNIGVSSHSNLQGDLPHPGIEHSLLHCRQILYSLNHQKSPKNTLMMWHLVYIPSCVLCLIVRLGPTLCYSMVCTPPGSSVRGEFSRQKCWSGLPCPLPNPGTEPKSTHTAGGFFTVWATREAQEYRSGYSIPSPWYLFPDCPFLPQPGIELGSPASKADSLPAEYYWGSPLYPSYC